MSEQLPTHDIIDSPEAQVILPFTATESFLDPRQAKEVWPEAITSNPEFIEQVSERKELVDSLDVIRQVVKQPTTKIEDAVMQGEFAPSRAATLYNSLTRLLEDGDYRRSLLYIPFEYLPSTSWQPDAEELQKATSAFRDAYMATWKNLLGTHDVRANFVDGDVLEIDQRTGDLPRVVKAAHLIPGLVQAGYLTVPEVMEIMENTDDPVLRDSVADALPVLTDLGLIERAAPPERVDDAPHELVTSEIVSKELAQAQIEVNDQLRGNETDKRKQWLSEIARERVIGKLAATVSEAIVNRTFLTSESARLLSEDATNESTEVLLEGIGLAVEEVARTDPDSARALFNSCIEIFNTASAEPKVRRSLTKVLRRSYGLGVADEQTLSRFGVSTPKLDESSIENIKEVGAELREIGSAIIESAEKSEVGSSIYPAVLAYGSHIKGYGEPESDLDTAIFVRPNTPLEKSDEINKVLPDSVEFWLDENGEQLSIHDFEEDGRLGQSSWTHILFGGVWTGERAAINELHDKLLTKYLYKTDEEMYGRNVREVWLEEMERDALQYRLMHKAYERFAARQGGINTPHSDSIDGKSTFWDSGYRRLALELYARRVFLPKLSKPE